MVFTMKSLCEYFHLLLPTHLTTQCVTQHQLMTDTHLAVYVLFVSVLVAFFSIYYTCQRSFSSLFTLCDPFVREIRET